jgi:flagellar biosynthesis/type III secretory pathway chaperone
MTTTPATPVTWQQLAECLRTELADYGGLLALFEEQQRALFSRHANEVLRLSTEIEGQARAVQSSRQRREDAVAAYATGLGQPPAATLRSLLPFVAAEARPLLEALIDEVNHLIHRVRRVSRHNHTLLSRTVELHQEILRTLRPDSFTQTYAPNGRMTLGAVSPTPALQAAG